MNELLNVVVLKRVLQGDDVVVIELARADRGNLPLFEAGAHIDVHLPSGVIRQYSLCGDPSDGGSYRLGVLRDPQSRGGSIAVHKELLEGVTVDISLPRNHFPLDLNAEHSILLGGGIGITPMLAMAYALEAKGKAFEMHYCARSRSRSAFLEELERTGFSHAVQLHFDDEPESKLDINRVLADSQKTAHIYTCGPGGFMEWVINNALELGYPDAHIHREYFQADIDTKGSGFEVVAARSGKTVNVMNGQTIYQALAEVGIDIEISCEQGVCGTCLCDVLEGEPDHRDVYLTVDEKAANDTILVCCSRSKSPRLVLDI
ncbi:ferredoxin [Pseudomonas syringae pv. japonica str. M301072]|uniref:Ferredoxin n=1 Tax=Pseudomonas syringae pv. japonica str. M301072 TaxID=629262 RepID=F3FFB2_PSESX|nr:ferredoxin [Pseudomonas syringae pv. japonica str. M301072]